MTAKEIAQQLTHGTNDLDVLVVEGKRAAEIAELFAKQMPSYSPDWNEQLTSYEGYLFPAKYSFAKNSTIQEVISAMTEEFDAVYKKVNNSTSLSKADIVTLASLIEREAKHDQDRALISSVLHNRLSINMPLQVDATIQYALGYSQTEQTWWKKSISFEDLTVNSPYNTYTHQGLPPGPICNPGFAALNAAANPANTSYFYYMTDKKGITHYGKTLAEHNENIKRFEL
jgi:UPF0755 protein